MRTTPESMSQAPVARARRPSEVALLAGRDVLSDVLEALGLESRVFCRSVLRAPWSLALRPGELAHFHVVQHGSAWLHVNGGDSFALAAGDLVVLPHGHGHELSDTARRRRLPSARRVQVGPSRQGCHVLQLGGRGAETQLVCGSFRFRERGPRPFLEVLPDVLHLPAGDNRTPRWLAATLDLLAEEARAGRAGNELVLSRTTDVLFVQVLRAWLDRQAGAARGWLGALRDPRVGAALATIHAEPARPWTVPALAARARLSRSPFAQRFKRLVGTPPLAYLTAWRMQLAADLLRRETLGVGEVAARVGYASEFAFRKAFKRRFGVAPGEFRRGG
jgi:AraC-like DNA-binding protein